MQKKGVQTLVRHEFFVLVMPKSSWDARSFEHLKLHDKAAAVEFLESCAPVLPWNLSNPSTSFLQQPLCTRSF
jgi:hypothetical protein